MANIIKECYSSVDYLKVAVDDEMDIRKENFGQYINRISTDKMHVGYACFQAFRYYHNSDVILYHEEQNGLPKLSQIVIRKDVDIPSLYYTGNENCGHFETVRFEFEEVNTSERSSEDERLINEMLENDRREYADHKLAMELGKMWN
jgi:hypothetical protein